MIPVTYNVRSLLVRKTTTLATALGIALVVFVLAAALMLGNGVKKTLGSTGRADYGFVLRKGSDAELASSIDNTKVGLVLAAPGIKHDEGGAPLGAGEIVVVIALEKEGEEAGRVSNVQVRGVSDGSIKLRPEVHVVSGRPPQPGTNEVMIGKRVQGHFKGVALGSSFDLKHNRKCQVVGVFESGGSSFESEVWADIDAVRAAFGREALVSSVTVKLESASTFDQFRAAVENDKQVGLEAMRQSTYYEKQSEGTYAFIMGLGITVAVLFSVGAMIGAMITMYAAVAQRRREIGTLNAIGFSRTSILVSFLLEAVLLAVTGGAAGGLAASAMGFVQFSMMNMQSWSEIVFSFDPTPQILGVAVAAGAAMGLFGGLFPALRAAMTSPVEAMRN